MQYAIMKPLDIDYSWNMDIYMCFWSWYNSTEKP